MVAGVLGGLDFIIGEPPSGPIKNAKLDGLAWLIIGCATGCNTSFKSASVCLSQSASKSGG